jgi:hypothetical protein
MQPNKALLAVSLALCSCVADPDSSSSAANPASGDTGRPSVPSRPTSPAAPDLPTDRDALIHLDLEAGHSIEFVELAPGMLSVVERTRGGVAPLAVANPSLEAIYAAARPGEAVPRVLRDVRDRGRDIARRSPRQTATAWLTGGGNRMQLRTASNADSFVNNGHCESRIIDGYPNIASTCKINWAGGFFAAASGFDTGIMSATAEAVQGSLTLRTQAGGNIRDTWVPEGTRLTQWAFGNPPGLLLRTDILNAASTWFHVGVQWMQCPRLSDGSNNC